VPPVYNSNKEKMIIFWHVKKKKWYIMIQNMGILLWWPNTKNSFNLLLIVVTLSFIQVSVITIYVKIGDVYTVFTLHVLAIVWASSGSIYTVTLTFSAISPSIGRCLHLGESWRCCLQCRMPVIDLKHINIKMYKNLKTFIPIFEGYTLFTVLMPFIIHLQTLTFFKSTIGLKLILTLS
jgi:hypothetical protein